MPGALTIFTAVPAADCRGVRRSAAGPPSASSASNVNHSTVALWAVIRRVANAVADGSSAAVARALMYFARPSSCCSSARSPSNASSKGYACSATAFTAATVRPGTARRGRAVRRLRVALLRSLLRAHARELRSPVSSLRTASVRACAIRVSATWISVFVSCRAT